jgi:beta-galactosidase
VWAERLKTTAPNAEVLLRYGRSNGWLDGQPAVVTRHYGHGRITYVGGVLDDKLMQAAAEWMTKTSEVTPAFGPVPDGVEVSRRIGPNGAVYVLINWRAEKRSVTLPHSMKSMLEQKGVTQIELPQYGVAALSDTVKPQ